jgi:hypothetical protein
VITETNASIADQLCICREFAHSPGLDVVQKFADYEDLWGT